MIVEILRDSNKRNCAICKKRILKGKIMVKYPEKIDTFGNHRMFFSHLDCLISRLQHYKKTIDDRLSKIPVIKYELRRFEAKQKKSESDS